MIIELVTSISLGIPTGILLVNYLDKDNREKQKIKNNLNYIFKEKNIKNSKEQYPFIKKIELKSYGFIAIIDIKKICSYGEIEALKDYIKTVFEAEEIIISYKNSYVEIEVVNNPIKEMYYKNIRYSEYELLLGFNLKGEPITVNMNETPHLLISGLSGQGKSYMTKTIIKNLSNASIVILNGFEEDYKSHKCVIGEEEILKYLEHIKANLHKRNKPFYLVFEEIQGFNNNKKIVELVKELLSFGRHFNIFIIGIIQIATKENCKFKDLFNARCSFKQIDSSSYNVCLGFSIQEQLQKREFYLFSNCLAKGKTYTI